MHFVEFLAVVEVWLNVTPLGTGAVFVREWGG